MEPNCITMPIDWKQLSPEWRAIIIAVFDAGHTCGGGEAVALPAHGETRELLLNVMARWEAESDAAAAWAPEIPKIALDEVPGWLLRQQRQTEVQR